MIGELIGHYRVVASLGSGGMGVVWKGIDTRLNRPVAMKAIRDADAANTDAILRLRAEALAAASLDHPYICKIYELLETGSATLVVMEFVEGENLGDILTIRTPALIDTLRYGSEIAEGLANAHARGIVHRDVKPSNVMVTPHNHIKLLDFGIARITAEAALTQSGLTLPGNTPGTPQYMAPEQALGKPLDGRADLFSLGVLLFRCLTGQLPFEGVTRDEYVQQMLSGPMRPLDQLAPAAPEPVRAIVKACLERDPARRPQSATVVAETLRRAADALSTGTIPVIHRPTAAIPRWAMQVAFLLIAAVGIAMALWRWPAAPPHDSVPRTLVPVVTWPSAESDALISPDGKWLSFISDSQDTPRIFIQAIEGGDAVAVSLPGAAVSHAWSPDGREMAAIILQSDGHFLTIVPAFFGGSPRVSIPLDASFTSPRVVRWLDDGVYLDVNLGQPGRMLMRASLAEGGTLRAVWPNPVRYRSLDIAADSRLIVMDATIDERSDLWTSNIDGSNRQRLTDDAFVERAPLWISRDVVAFESNRGGQMDLWQMPISTKRAVQLTSSLMAETPTGAAGDGTIAFEQLANTVNLWRVTLDSKGAHQVTGDALSDYWPSATVDGSKVAFQRARPTPAEGFQFIDARIMVSPIDAARDAQPQAVADGFGARISPDGNWVAYYQRLPVSDRLRLLVKNLSTGEVRTLSDNCVLPSLTPTAPVDWIEQNVTWGAGTDIYFLVGGVDRHEIHRADVRRSEPPSLLAAATPGGSIRDVRVSSDGRMLAYLMRLRKPAGAVSAGDRSVDIRVRNLDDNTERLFASERDPSGEVFLTGWTARDSLLIHRARVSGAAGQVTFTAINADGTRRSIPAVTDAFFATVRLAPGRSRVFLTRAVSGIQNIFALDLADGRIRQLTSNEAPGVSFSGIQPLGDSAIVFARDERRRDIWLVRPK